MRALLIFLAGLLLGAALFHVYYLGLAPAARCGWDHPVDHAARSRCEAAGRFEGYASGARRQLDDLIGNVSH